jgi:hypothetical protein
MSLTFLENDLKLDASGLTIGTGSTDKISTHLTINQTSTAPTTFNVTTSGSPFSATLTKVGGSTQDCLLEITFNQPLANLQFNVNHALTITANTGDTYTLNVEINYANAFNSSNWTNSADVVAVDDIDFKGPLTSLSLNNKIRSILTNAIDALNQARMSARYYFFKEKYLSDIVEFAIEAGSTLESSGAAITYNSDGTINYIVKTYDTGRGRNQKVKISYTYASFDIIRIQKRGITETNLETTVSNLVTDLQIDALNNSDLKLYTIGKVHIERNSSATLYAIPYLKDYNNALTATDPDNIMADYKYYKTNTITGWTVTV